MSETFPRDLLAKHFGDDKRMIAAFEEQDAAVQAASSGVAETQALKDATVIVLSANGEFTNERVLEVGEGIAIEVTAAKVKLSVKDVARTERFRVTLIPEGDATLFLPLDGALLSSIRPRVEISTIGNYANDAAAAAGGVLVGEFYRNGSALMVRVA